MYLPNRHLAFVTEDKVVEYLLNPAHKIGGSKARFFLAFGFSTDDWQTMAEVLVELGQSHKVAHVDRSSPFGIMYRVIGHLRTPDGRDPYVRTVWMIGYGTKAPRLISAYPEDGGEE